MLNIELHKKPLIDRKRNLKKSQHFLCIYSENLFNFFSFLSTSCMHMDFTLFWEFFSKCCHLAPTPHLYAARSHWAKSMQLLDEIIMILIHSTFNFINLVYQFHSFLCLKNVEKIRSLLLENFAQCDVTAKFQTFWKSQRWITFRPMGLLCWWSLSTNTCEISP